MFILLIQVWLSPYTVKKVKFALEQTVKAQRGGRRIAQLLFLVSALDRGGWSAPRPSRFTPGKETRYPLHRWFSGPQDPSGRVRKTSLLRRFDPRTAQLLVSRYTGSAITARISKLHTKCML
jgi:hypothetical protein